MPLPSITFGAAVTTKLTGSKLKKNHLKRQKKMSTTSMEAAMKEANEIEDNEKREIKSIQDQK